MRRRSIRRRSLLAAAVASSLLATGCASPARNPDLGRPLAVLTSLGFTTNDPAVANDEASDTLAYNTFQRLLTVQPGTSLPRPDAAECKFIDDVTYTCMLRKGLTFINGDKVTAEDVRFSIERARRLAGPGMPGRMFDTIAEIEVKSDRRIDFALTQPDNNLAFALASPAGSIVNKKFYPADAPRTGFERPIGSGPFFLLYLDPDQARLVRYPGYGGAVYAHPQAVTLYSTREAAVADRLLATDRVDVLWGATGSTGVAPSTMATIAYEGLERSRLLWNPDSPQRANDALRAYVRDATAPLRTQTSNLPAPQEPQPGEFPRDARATPPGGQVRLTLGFSPRDRRAAAMADKVRAELVKAPNVAVTLAPDDRAADVWVTFDRTSTASLLTTLQPWTDFPLPGRQQRISELVSAFRRTQREDDRRAAATALLKAAADDAVLVPLTQNDQAVSVRRGMKIDKESKLWAGPNGQLGAWQLQW